MRFPLALSLALVGKGTVKRLLPLAALLLLVGCGGVGCNHKFTVVRSGSDYVLLRVDSGPDKGECYMLHVGTGLANASAEMTRVPNSACEALP